MTRVLAMVWPDLRVPEVPPEVRATWEPMLDALDDLSPRVEAVDVGVGLVDVTGLGPLWGTERRIAARAMTLARAVRPLPVRCGIGDNRWLATLAARLARFERPAAAAAFHALPPGADAARQALRDLPLALLPADVATRQRFALFGLAGMGQLADLPRSAVGAQFGPAGERLQALARGQDPRPLVPRRRPKRVEATVSFEPPLEGVGSAALALRRLAGELCDGLRVRHLAPGRATLSLALEDAPALGVTLPLPEPVLEPDWIARLLLSRLEAATRIRADVRAQGTVPLIQPVNGRQRHWVAAPPAGPLNLSKSQHNDVRNLGFEGEGVPSMHQPSVWHGSTRSELVAESDEPRVAALTLAFDRLSDPATRQLPAFEARAGRWEELRWSLERIRHRFGSGRIWRAEVERPTAVLPERRSRLAEIGQ